MFYEWLKQAPADSLTGVQYGVFGCGHPDWAATYHAIPKSMDKLLSQAGGTRLVARGVGNAAVAELFEEFDDWEAQFMAAIATTQVSGNGDTALPSKKALHVSVDTTRREQTLRLDKMVSATIVSNEIISGISKEKGEKGYNVKRHIEISLPKGITYQTGDYLAILPTNPDQTVQRALRRFNLHPDDVLTIQGRSINLPLDTPVSAYELLNGFVELGQPATKRQIENLLHQMPDNKSKETLVRFTHEEVYQKELATKRYSLLDILDDYPDISMEFGDFLLSLPALRIRQVSLAMSYSPRSTRKLTTSTRSLHPRYTTQPDAQSLYPSLPRHIYQAMAISWAPLHRTSQVEALVRLSEQQCGAPQHSSPLWTPLSRSFWLVPALALLHLEHFSKKGLSRSEFGISLRCSTDPLRSSGREVAHAFLYYGCHSEADALYSTELRKWEEEGIVSVRYAFSRDTGNSNGSRYVQ